MLLFKDFGIMKSNSVTFEIRLLLVILSLVDGYDTYCIFRASSYTGKNKVELYSFLD